MKDKPVDTAYHQMQHDAEDKHADYQFITKLNQNIWLKHVAKEQQSSKQV